jgi:hypothetical protein
MSGGGTGGSNSGSNFYHPLQRTLNLKLPHVSRSQQRYTGFAGG